MNLEEVIHKAHAFYESHEDRLRDLRIAILTPAHIQKLGAGDWKQAENTVAAMRALGLRVDHLFLAPDVSLNLDNYDVLHLMPFNLGRYFDWSVRRDTALIVGSTVFWDSWRHRWIAQPRRLSKIGSFVRYHSQSAAGGLARSGLGYSLMPQRLRERYGRFLGTDLLLPNSFSEIQCIRSAFVLRADTCLEPAPNGTDPFACDAGSQPLPPELPQRDFVLYPGVFSARKNQLGFIRAMRRLELPVIFMGGPISEESRKYFDQCRSEAPGHYHFPGKVAYRSELFCSLMRRARVSCLASSCETPGLAALEAASLGSRIAITHEGGPEEYLGNRAEYFSPIRGRNIRQAVLRAWERGRDETQREHLERFFSWRSVAQTTASAYLRHLSRKRGNPMRDL